MLSQQAKFAPPIAADEKVVALLAQAEISERPLPILEVDGQTRASAIAARQELGKIAPEAASLVSVTAVSLADIAARLDPQETLINYFSAGDVLYALVMNGATIKGYKLDAKGLEGEIRIYREALEAADPKAVDQGRRLHARLIAPIASEIKGKKLTISPHSAMHYLPFGTLSDGKKYLLENYSLRMTPSANTLAYVHTDKPNKAGRVLALGNPDLDDPKLDLPAAQNEVQQVVGMFPASKALVRKDATKAAVKELGNGFSIIHIASHGQFDADTPLNSGLLLAKSGSEEGRLTVGDLYTMRLDTELVTLSACETALGKVASGDDVVGLTRGFLYAGTRSIVASLWQVDDAATAKLMTAFYKNLALKLDKREALRMAQIETKKAYPHPFYWGAFQITGAAN
jgi:CHAT domain-containing protein